MSAVEFEYANDDDDDRQQQRGECEIGSLEMPRSEWLFSSVATFQQSYGQVHPYLAAVLCIVGTLMNAITVLVLTRPSMRSPVNVLLSAVAVCDIVVMSSYLVFVVHFLLTAASRCEPSDFSYGWALFMIFHAHASVIFHAASIWMTVSLAQIRVLTIRRATAGPSSPLVTERFTVLLAVLMLCAMTLVNLPNFLTFEIMEVPSSSMLPCLHSPDSTELENDGFSQNVAKVIGTDFSQNDTAVKNEANAILNVKMLNDSELNISNHSSDNLTFTTITTAHRMRRHRETNISRHSRGNSEPVGTKDSFAYTVRAHDSDCMKLKLAFWSNGMIFKVIPCLLLTLSIWALLRIIADVAHKRRNLAQVMRKKVVPKDHTTPMLAAVLLIFLLAELPQGLFLVLNGIFSAESFHKRVYLPLGDLMDLLSLLNSAVGFFIYVGMSRKFRTVFLQLLFSVLSFLTRTELFLATVLRPMPKLVLPCRRCESAKRRGIAAENVAKKGEESGAMGGIHQSLRRLRERLEIVEEFSETLQLLEDTAQRGEAEKRRRTRECKGSTNGRQLERRADRRSAKEQLHSRSAKRHALAKTRSRSTEHKSAMDDDKRNRNAEDGPEHHRWRRRTSGTSGASCLLSGAEQYSQQQQHRQHGQNGGGADDIWDGGKRRKRKQFESGRGRGWTSWRRRKMSGWTSTEITRTEQLSFCPNSFVAFPPLTLALSCSAGITAAAASVGVQLLQLEQPPPASSSAASVPSRRFSSHLSSVLLTLPASSAHAIRRRTSELTTATDKNFLQVPKRPSKMFPIEEKGQPKRAASFISLKGNDAEREEKQQKCQNGEMAQPRKRISFNLPIEEEGQQQQRKRRSENALGIVQQLRRWSTRDGESGERSKETDGVKNESVLENGRARRTNSNASLLTIQKQQFKGIRRHGTIARILCRWNGQKQAERETAIDESEQRKKTDDQDKTDDQTDQNENGGWAYC
ncbi:hypothetical protein niasHS_013262 [Heterodera schachtii]|uniref:G-protein coupled receptors family 1 profile domain-containing protein n=1 Tax=Heterodera schachtii TaxID=97005 RepID=A0ABD2IM37_HETSC